MFNMTHPGDGIGEVQQGEAARAPEPKEQQDEEGGERRIRRRRRRRRVRDTPQVRDHPGVGVVSSGSGGGGSSDFEMKE